MLWEDRGAGQVGGTVDHVHAIHDRDAQTRAKGACWYPLTIAYQSCALFTPAGCRCR